MQLPAQLAALSIAKSTRNHAGFESHLQLENQAATTEAPFQHPAEEPDECSDAEPSRLHCSRPCLQSYPTLLATILPKTR